MLRHLAGTIILILFGISCAEKRSWTEVTFEHDSYIKVPLTINGDVHWYIFDTGAGVSTILSELAVKYNLRNEREEELAAFARMARPTFVVFDGLGVTLAP